MREVDYVFGEITDYEHKCLCVFVIDTFSLMDDKAIDEVTLGIQRILDDIESDDVSRERVEVAFITHERLSDEIRIIKEPVPIRQAVIPLLTTTTDDTSLMESLYVAMDVVETWKERYKSLGISYYRPWIFLISNGLSLVSCNHDEIANRIKQDTSNKKYVFLPIYTKDAKVPLLQEIESDVPITALDSLNITDCFKWLSASMGTIVSAEEGQQAGLSAEPSDWMDAFTIDGSEEEIDMDCLPNEIKDVLSYDVECVFDDTDTFEPNVHPTKSKGESISYMLKRIFTRRESSYDVFSSVFAPAEVKRKFNMIVQVYLHLYEETEKVKSLAHESDKNAVRRDYIPLQCKLKKGDKVDVQLNIYGETLLMSDKKSVVWQGSFTKCSFDYFVPKDIDVDELSCVALLTVNGVPVGEMRFITRIVDAPRQLNPEIIAHKYNKVFISYSHQDESKVKFLHEGLELGAVPHFFDRKYLKAGDVFPQVIKEYINSADLFILCWSENA